MPKTMTKEGLLSQVPMFASLNRKELKAVARLVDEIGRPAGSMLARKDELGREFFLILEGKAAVVSGNRKLATLGPGQFFGEISLLDRGPRTASVKAETDLRLFVVSVREFSGLLDQVPGMARRLLVHLCGRLRECERSLLH